MLFHNQCSNDIAFSFDTHISSLTGECAAEKFKNICSSSLWTSLHQMVMLRSQNQITDFFSLGMGL